VEPPAQPTARPAARTRASWVSIGLNVLLFVVACGLGLYAFMLNVDLGDLKRRLSREVEVREQTERYLVETRNLLSQSQRELEELKARLDLAETGQQATHAAKPPMPVVVGFRSSLVGRGMVAVLENASDRYLSVVLATRNPTLSTARRFNVELPPRSAFSFGHLEGWQFASGDELSVFHEDYAPLRLHVP
jgi:hypothetical protein